MKNKLIFLLLIFSPGFIQAQNFTFDTISIEKRMLSADLGYQGKNLSLMKLEDLCSPFADANDELLQAKRNNNPALILTLVGAVLIGYSGVKWISDGELPWYYAAGGAVMIGCTIPLYIGSRNHSINAARIYNYEMKHKQVPKP
ncbi:MAG TPA: hypothetical protein PKN48_08805 [Bacteroidales bacterium]|nr:hypothetical protein [Bacteroidales bacterium]